MSKRVRISNETLNSYGTRVLTAGMNIDQYCRNPVLLYMHERGSVIGYVKDVRIEGDEITGELMFDEATELSKQCKKQYEFGSLKMVSAGIDVLELSEDKELLIQGQTRPTITKSKLFEVSLVDIGANDDAIVMHKDGKRVELGKDGENILPLLNKSQIQKFMEQKVLALLLGLPETATEADIRAEIEVLKAAKADVVTLRTEKETLTLNSITSIVETAISEKRITADRKEQFITLGKTVGIEDLKKTFEAMSPQVKLSQLLGHQGGTPTSGAPQTFQKLSDVPADKLEEMREKDPTTYKRLYKAEYGMDADI